jgi:hypothetical protein
MNKRRSEQLWRCRSKREKRFVIGMFIFMGVFIWTFMVPVYFEWQHNYAVRNSPIVDGEIIAREEILRFGIVPCVEFTIRLLNQGVTVHAQAQRYLINKVPGIVRFHYDGNPSREVFLHEYEEDPFWILLICSTSFFIIPCLVYKAYSSPIGSDPTRSGTQRPSASGFLKC